MGVIRNSLVISSRGFKFMILILKWCLASYHLIAGMMVIQASYNYCPYIHILGLLSQYYLFVYEVHIFHLQIYVYVHCDYINRYRN
jgi:hypothetical protein